MSSSSDEDLPRISFSPVRATGGEEEDIMVVDGSPVSSSRGVKGVWHSAMVINASFCS